MELEPEKRTIATLFGARKQFVIPRFQREYAWGKPQLKEFLNDIVSQINCTGGHLLPSEYFWGSMLFVGSFVSPRKTMEVVDGQQRLTTITIFLSILAKIFAEQGKKELADSVLDFISFRDIDGVSQFTLLNESPYPFFQRLVQRADIPDVIASSKEEERIKFAYEFFERELKSKPIEARMKAKPNTGVYTYNYIEALKVIRSQLLDSIIICVTTPDVRQANVVFEILNAKGKALDSLDLIKNEIFTVITTETPSDEAKLKWKNVNETLNSRTAIVDLFVFFRTFWASNYGDVPSRNDLFTQFKKVIKPRTEQNYMDFLTKLEKEAKLYVQITSPDLSIDFGNRIEYKYLTETLKNLKDFGIKQTNILFFAMFYGHKANLIGPAMFKKTMLAVEVFHFVYNALLSLGTNVLEKIYMSSALALRKCTTKDAAHNILKDLITRLNDLLHNESRSIIENEICNLTYSKSETNKTANLKSRYVLRALMKADRASDFVPEDASIEHIENEVAAIPFTRKIGNLMLIEKSINENIPLGAAYALKVEGHYSQSTYPPVKDFVDSHPTTWGEMEIDRTGKATAKKFYDEFFAQRFLKF